MTVLEGQSICCWRIANKAVLEILEWPSNSVPLLRAWRALSRDSKSVSLSVLSLLLMLLMLPNLMTFTISRRKIIYADFLDSLRVMRRDLKGWGDGEMGEHFFSLWADPLNHFTSTSQRSLGILPACKADQTYSFWLKNFLNHPVHLVPSKTRQNFHSKNSAS